MQVNSERLFEYGYAFMRSHAWLFSTDKEKEFKADFSVEKQAVSILFSIDSLTEKEWEIIPSNVRVTVQVLFLDFVSRLPRLSKQWEVADNLTGEQQLISVIQAEIKRSHGASANVH